MIAAPVPNNDYAGESLLSATVATTSGTIPAVENELYLAHIVTGKAAGGSPAVSSVAGLGLTWALVAAQCAGQNTRRLEVWYAIGSPTSDGAVTATLASAPDVAYISVQRWSGAVTAAPIGASSKYNTNGVNGACSGGADNDDATGAITTTADNSAVVVGVAFDVDESLAATSGWTELNRSQTSSEIIGLGTEYKRVATAGAVTVGAANNLESTTDWALVAVEILGAERSAAPRALARFYDPGTGRALRDIVAWQ